MIPNEGAYACGVCGEEIVIPLDPSGGRRQSFTEDCPVCCHPHVIEVWFDDDGSAVVQGTAE